MDLVYMANLLVTTDQLTRVLPRNLKRTITQDLVDNINNLSMDTVVRDAFKENLLSYTNVIQDGRFRIDKYIEAVRYVTHKLMGDTNIVAYAKTFPDRYQKFISNGTSQKDLASYVTSYNKNKLVNLIFEQTLVPSSILNADLYQKALNVQAALMIDDDVSPKVRSDAANSLLVHLKLPDTQKIELDIGVKQDSTIDALRASTLELVSKQKAMLQAHAMTAKEIAETKVVNVTEGEYEQVN